VKIYKRKIFNEIVKYIDTDDVLVLHGARQVGKTYLLHYLRDYLEQKGKINYYIDLEDSRYLKILNAGIDAFLAHLKEQGFSVENDDKKVYVFVDEIQYLVNPSSFLKLISDHYRQIKLIVSGSSSFEIKNKFKDSLVGRTVNFEIYPLSFEEFLLFKKYYADFKSVFSEKKVDELRLLYREFVLYGGYPRIVLTSKVEMKEKYLQQIIDTYIRKDIRDLGAIRELGKFNKLLEILASQSGQLVNVVELANTCNLSKQTVSDYLFLLEQTYVLGLVRPFSSNLRFELTKMPKVMFYDSGLMQMLWLKGLQREILGSVFETNVFGELVKKYNRKSVYFWRTIKKQEIDFVLKVKNDLLPIEVKLNFAKFNFGNVKYFLEKYKLNEYKVTALEGERKDKSCVYPWEL